VTRPPRWAAAAQAPSAERPHQHSSTAKLARASVSGAVSLALAQRIDIRLTGRAPSDTPVRAVEALTGRPVQGSLARAAIGYGVQSVLAPISALAASRTGADSGRRLGAALLAPVAFATLVSPALGASARPIRWTASDWVRELTLKGSLALAVVATL